ncbi:DNA transposase THAP9 isoform X1 [Neocloeon triangulifer]|uniref:DNA transposase THAP9 isoform X1 n=1 Tax=Neocloeon triangulifer TaxID=2078957 RepID=UPI00286F9FA4|nr:DNA transposase THAP9 isoform X1 [Neocloeon triangulifer]XP_059474643.1 DNA transposase THAP9 isoform X1 [Neocloeon triangulifer]
MEPNICDESMLPELQPEPPDLPMQKGDKTRRVQLCTLCGRKRPISDDCSDTTRFPLFRLQNVKKPEVRELWTSYIKRFYPSVTIVNSLQVCDLHFEMHMIQDSGSRKILVEGAFPSIFVANQFNSSYAAARKRISSTLPEVAPGSKKSRRKLIESSLSGEEPPRPPSLPNMQLDVSGCEPSLDASLGAVNYPAIYEIVTRQDIYDLIKSQQEAVAQTFPSLVFAEETPIRQHFNDDCASLECKLNEWISRAEKPETRAPFEIKFEFKKLQKTYSLRWRYYMKNLAVIQNKEEINRHDEEINKYKIINDQLLKENGRVKKILKTLQKKLNRSNDKLVSMQELITKLTEETIFSPEIDERLKNLLPATGYAFMQRIGKQATEGANRKEQFTEKEREFALTLHFYSTCAYEFVRSNFPFALPCVQTIKTWLRANPTDVGINEVALSILKIRADEYKARGEQLYVAFSFDDMSVKKQLDFDNSRVWGYADMGTKEGEKPIVDVEAKVAQYARVILATAINGRWKWPCALYFVDSLNAVDSAKILNDCILKVEATGAKVLSVTFDGTPTNIATANELGAKLNVHENPQHYFPNPTDKNRPIYVFLDACHMIKLVRNCFGSKIIYSGKGKIDFTYVRKLHNFQIQQGLHLANKLRNKHINYHQNKMKVPIAVQTLSQSVADSIKFLMHKGHKDFEKAEATVEFLEMFDSLFDICNSRNPKTLGKKAPVERKNHKEWSTFFNTVTEYIKSLKLENGVSILRSKSFTGFFGFIVCMRSISSLYENFIKGGKGNKEMLGYLLTYKFSQDHLEMFFGALRRKGGHNDNPCCKNLFVAYKYINTPAAKIEKLSGYYPLWRG